MPIPPENPNTLVRLKFAIVTDAKSNWMKSQLFLEELVNVMKKNLMPGTIHTNFGEMRYVDIIFHDDEGNRQKGGKLDVKDNKHKELPKGNQKKML